jgi:hypothetical protein
VEQVTLNHVRSEVKEPGLPNALPIPSERGDAGRRFIVHADENGLRVYESAGRRMVKTTLIFARAKLLS